MGVRMYCANCCEIRDDTKQERSNVARITKRGGGRDWERKYKAKGALPSFGELREGNILLLPFLSLAFRPDRRSTPERGHLAERSTDDVHATRAEGGRGGALCI